MKSYLTARLFAFALLTAIAFIAAVYVRLHQDEPPVNLRDALHAKAFFEERGFACAMTSDIARVVVVSDAPLPRREMIEFIAFIGSGLRSHAGKVLVRDSAPEGFELSDKSRCWGKLFAFGDAALLDRMEIALGVRP